MGKRIDITGEIFGRLTVIEPADSHKSPCGHTETRWKCLCDCGKYINTATGRLRSGGVKSCGCFSVEATKKRNTTHGHTINNKESVEFRAWLSMRGRCSRSSHHAYHNYGGRGISVCNRWDDFGNFFSDMGERPSDKHSLERKNNNKDYYKENCRWATRKEQTRNRRVSIFLTANGLTMVMQEWAIRTGIKYCTLWARKKRGWTDCDVINTPMRNSQ